MTSKEALQHIINMVSDDTYYRDRLEEEFETLQKDLEVLELLRKNCFRGYYVDDYVINFEDMTFTELKQIEEWLENESTNTKRHII